MSRSDGNLVVDVIIATSFCTCLILQAGFGARWIQRQWTSRTDWTVWRCTLINHVFRQGPYSPDPTINKFVTSRLGESRLRFIRSSVSLLSLVLFLPALHNAYRVFSGNRGNVSEQQYIVFTLGYASLTVCNACPRILTLRTHLVIFSYFMFVLIAYNCPIKGGDRLSLISSIGHAQVVSLVGSLGYFDFRAVLLLHAFQDTAYVITYALVDAGTGFPQVSVADFCLQRVYTFCEKAVALYIVERLVLSCILREAEATQEKSLRLAFRSLLSIMCDAVVELGSDQRIVQHEPRLSYMLLHGTGKSLEGATLQEFLPDASDQQRLEERLLCRSGEGSEDAAMLHLRMKDAIGNRIRMQCFHVAFTSFEAEVHHLVGLCEDTERSGPAAPLDRAEAAPCRADQAIEDSGSDSSSASEVSHASPRVDREVAVQVCVRDGRLPVLWSSRRFRDKFGKLIKGVDFVEWVAQGQELQSWMSERVQSIYSGTTDPGVAEFSGLTITPYGRSSVRSQPRMVMAVFQNPGDDEHRRWQREEYPITLLIGHQVVPSRAPHGSASAGTSRDAVRGDLGRATTSVAL